MPSQFSSINANRLRLPPGVVVLAIASVLLSVGCRGRAKEDVYRQQVASELRVLEDQLYEADYENRVLRDRVELLQQKTKDTDSIPRSIKRRPTPPENVEESQSPSSSIEDIEIDDLGDMEDIEIILGDPADDVSTGDHEAEQSLLLPAPGGPEPPGAETLDQRKVIEGEIIPPPTGELEEKPDGQIEVEEVQSHAAAPPSSLRIHQGLSGGHRFDGSREIDGMYLVINAVDSVGKTVDLSLFDIDAELTIVASQPDDEEQEIDRWNFTAEEVQTLVKKDPISGLYVPLRWHNEIPSSRDINVHVRLRSDGDEMKCHQSIRVTPGSVASQWTPRGDF